MVVNSEESLIKERTVLKFTLLDCMQGRAYEISLNLGSSWLYEWLLKLNALSELESKQLKAESKA